MLQSIRDRLVGWVAWGIVILIGVPFAIIGVTDFGTPARTIAVAEVNDIPIDQGEYQRRYQLRRQGVQRQLEASYNPEIFDPQLQRQVVSMLIEEALLREVAEDNNIHVGDDELALTIQSDPGFQKAGQFDFNEYQARIGQEGFTPTRYEQFLRQERILTILPRMIRASSFATHGEAKRLNDLSAHKRDVSYVVINKDLFPDDINMSEDGARAYYDSHRGEFRRPEQIKLEYLRVSASQLTDRVEVTDDSLRRYYEEHSDRYIVDEQRKASHILIALPEGELLENSAEALEKFNTVKDKLSAGEDFAELARQYSDDPGSASEGGDLGQVTLGMMVKPFETALFAMGEIGEISEPVRTSFGYHFIRLDEVIQSEEKSFDEVRQELVEGYAEQESVGLFYDVSEHMAELSYESQDSLIPVSEALEIPLQTTDWISQGNENSGIEGNLDVLREAFSERLRTGSNSEPIEIDRNDAVIIRVADYREAMILSFDDVKDQALSGAKNAATDAKLNELAHKLAEKVRNGGSFEELAGQHDLALENIGLIGRDDQSLPAGMLSEVFKMPAPAENSISVAAVSLPDSKYGVVLLNKIMLPETENELLVRELGQRYAARAAQSVVTAVRETAIVIIHEDKL